MLRAVSMNDSGRLLTPDVIDYLNNSLSKLGIAILKELYKSPRMQQKNLAASIHTSTTSLSNIICRLEDIQPQLLVSERVGRSKYYSLTEIASSYVAQVILPQTKNKIHEFSTRSPKDSLLSEALDSLYHFQDEAGSEWDFILDNLLLKSYIQLLSTSDIQLPAEAIVNGKDELFILYTAFIDQMKQLQTLNKDALMQEVYDILSQPILIKRLRAILEKELSGFYALKPLFDMEQQNLRKTTRLIDNIFMELASDVFQPLNAYAPHYNTVLPDEQYNMLFHEIFIMKNEFNKPEYRADKEKVIEHWQEKYFWQGYSLMYIAEKCSEIYRSYHIGSR